MSSSAPSNRSAHRCAPVAASISCAVMRTRLARILEGDVDFAAHLPVRVVGEANAAGLGEPLQARGHVDAVAENIAAVEDDVAEIDADAELDAGFRTQGRVALGHAALDVQRA